jgi:Fe-S cluster assembly iron-binding protein IscA
MDVSKSAAFVIADHVRRRDEGQGGFRIRCGGHAESSLGLVIGYVDAPAPGDIVVEAGTARVFVAEDAHDIVDSYTLDVRKNGTSQQLFLRA